MLLLDRGQVHTKPTPFRIATYRSPIATQLQHIVTQLQIFAILVMRPANLRVMVAIHIYVAISTVAIENVAIELLQLTML
jgi:hypothetical protein